MVRFAPLPCVVVALVAVLGVSTPSQAQELLAFTGDAVTANEQGPPPVAAAPAISVKSMERRPAALLPLYASFATLQVLDLHSTHYALERGAVEANPTVKGLTGSTAAMAAMKAAGTAGVIFVSEKLQKRNKAAALGLMIAANSMMAWVVQHNYGAVR
jgi:hypothetical protein